MPFTRGPAFALTNRPSFATQLPDGRSLMMALSQLNVAGAAKLAAATISVIKVISTTIPSLHNNIAAANDCVQPI
jgi:hypothetical protein